MPHDHDRDKSFPLKNLHRSGNSYLFRESGHRRHSVVHIAQLRQYLEHDSALRTGDIHHLVPAGYSAFADFLHYSSSDKNVKFAMIRDDSAEVLNTNTRSPTLTFIIGQEDADTRHTADQEKESGTWISKERADMIEDVLWEYMEKGQKGKKLRNQAIQRRRAKQSKPRPSLGKRLKSPPARNHCSPPRKESSSHVTQAAPTNTPVAVEQQPVPIKTSEDVAMEEYAEEGAAEEGAYVKEGDAEDTVYVEEAEYAEGYQEDQEEIPQDRAAAQVANAPEEKA